MSGSTSESCFRVDRGLCVQLRILAGWKRQSMIYTRAPRDVATLLYEVITLVITTA